jgi:hypothetical protein
LGDAGTIDTTTVTPPPARDASAEDFCTVANADAGTALFHRCDDYDIGAALSLGSDHGATIAAAPATGAPSPPNVLEAFYPASVGTFCNAIQDVALSFVAKRVELSFDLRIERTRGKEGHFSNIGGFERDSVYNYIVIDYEADLLRLAEQDQRAGGTVNSWSPDSVPVSFDDWHRVVFVADYEAGNVKLSVVGGATIEFPLAIPQVDQPGHWKIGSVYISENEEPIRYRFDNVVTRAW